MGGGTGSAWGAARYGDPSAVSLSQYQADPNKYQSFDRSDLANQAMAGIGTDIATGQARTLGRAAQMGAGRSAGVNRQLSDAQAAGENRMAQTRANMAQAGWQDRLAQMAAENAFNQNRDQLALSKYGTEAGMAQAERAQRRQATSQLPFGGLINLFGGY